MNRNELLERIENVVEEILTAFDVDQPPIPVELMLRNPPDGMWDGFDLTELSTTFLTLSDRFAPRMSVVRLLARNIVRSEWGIERELQGIVDDGEMIRYFARAIVMPRSMIDELENPLSASVSTRFEVPEEDAEIRLRDLGEIK
jgi:hypothetical protein